MADETIQRGHWGKEIDFLLSCIGYAVGLGNVWRFPYLCMRNGGGAFLIPYFFFMFVAGVPLYFLELSLGQYSGKSPLAVFEFCPLFEGLGWGMVILSALCSVYYSTIIAWIIYYLGIAFTSWEPVWGKCNNEWNTFNCFEPGNDLNSTQVNSTQVNSTQVNFTFVNSTSLNSNVYDAIYNFSQQTKTMSAGEEFWQYNVLSMSDGMEHIGKLRWQLVICHFVGWITVFLCIIKGVRTSGKVVYVTATAPYILLTALLIRGVTLPGSLDGILFYVQPDWQKLLSFKIWSEACLQIFYSLGPAWGGILTMASYNKFHHNVYRDAIIIPIVTCCTSFFAGFVIFAVIGYMAHVAGVPVQDAITSGPGLAFIAYPAALSQVPGPAIWSVLFFLMLLTIGLDSQFVQCETCVSALCDRFPRTLRPKKLLVGVVFSVVSSLVGLLFVTEGGIFWFQIVDWYIAMFTLLLIGILTTVSICYVYGINRFFNDIEMMLGTRPTRLWKVIWAFVTPVTLSIFFIYLLSHQVAPYYGDYIYPDWAIGIGWIIATSTALPIPFFMIKNIIREKGSLLDRIRSASRPSSKWIPAYCSSEPPSEQSSTVPLCISSEAKHGLGKSDLVLQRRITTKLFKSVPLCTSITEEEKEKDSDWKMLQLV